MGGKLYIQLAYLIDLTPIKGVKQTQLILNLVLLPIPQQCSWCELTKQLKERGSQAHTNVS